MMFMILQDGKNFVSNDSHTFQIDFRHFPVNFQLGSFSYNGVHFVHTWFHCFKITSGHFLQIELFFKFWDLRVFLKNLLSFKLIYACNKQIKQSINSRMISVHSDAKIIIYNFAYNWSGILNIVLLFSLYFSIYSLSTC